MKLFKTLAALAMLFFATSVNAHVFIENPKADSSVAASTEVTVTWNIVVPHGAATYDLMFSTDGGTTFAMLLAGVTARTTEYAWTTPDRDVPAAQLVIVQHGDGNYTFMNELDFSIVRSNNLDGPPDVGNSDSGTTDAGTPDAGTHPPSP
jgi:hypothetical protein